MSDAPDWFAARTATAPTALRQRAAEFLAAAPADGDRAAHLAAAATLALERTLAQGDGRATALDLLTADGLLTLALLAQGEGAPGGLDSFAAGIVSAASA